MVPQSQQQFLSVISEIVVLWEYVFYKCRLADNFFHHNRKPSNACSCSFAILDSLFITIGPSYYSIFSPLHRGLVFPPFCCNARSFSSGSDHCSRDSFRRFGSSLILFFSRFFLATSCVAFLLLFHRYVKIYSC